MRVRTFNLVAVAFVFVSSVSHAALRVRECNYDIHASRVSNINECAYMENRLELRKRGNVFRGSTGFSTGARLTVEVKIIDGQIAIRSKIENSGQSILKMNGVSDAFVNRTYALHDRKPDPAFVGTPTEEWVYVRSDLTCQVVEETVSDRLADLMY